MTASHPGFCRLIARALLAAALLGALPAQAATLFGVVTDRAAPAAVEAACGVNPALPEWLAGMMDAEERYTVLPSDLKMVEDHINRHARAVSGS